MTTYIAGLSRAAEWLDRVPLPGGLVHDTDRWLGHPPITKN
jgi:hypothetical protein